ncbi:MAG: hypothetical protein ABI808_10075 [Pseudonocardiales bacterium]
MTLISLIGGGWSPQSRDAVYGPFLAAAGPQPAVACVVIDEGDGQAEYQRWQTVLAATASCEPFAVLVPLNGRFDVSQLDRADALLVCGGLTPAYAAALAPVAAPIRDWLAAGRPYAGFSAGAAIAADRALIGGWLLDGRPVCPEDSSEDLDEVTVVPGLGLLPVSVDVHCSQWGNLSRAVAAVRAGLVPSAIAIDEDTAFLVQADGAGLVAGAGAMHVITRHGAGVIVTALTAGQVTPQLADR